MKLLNQVAQQYEMGAKKQKYAPGPDKSGKKGDNHLGGSKGLVPNKKLPLMPQGGMSGSSNPSKKIKKAGK